METQNNGLKKFLQGTGICLVILGAILPWIIIVPQLDQLPQSVSTMIIIFYASFSCYVIYVCYLLLFKFSPRSVQHLSAILSLVFVSSVWKYFKNFDDYWGPVVAGIISASGLVFLWIFYRLFTKGLQKVIWGTTKFNKTKTEPT